MNQKTVQLFESTCGKAKIFVENDMPIGVFHDFLMLMKGLMVDRMVQAQKEQEEVSKAMKKQSDIDDQITQQSCECACC